MLKISGTQKLAATTLAALLMIFPLASTSNAEVCTLEKSGTKYLVGSWSDLQAIANCDALEGRTEFEMTSDIDLAGITLTPLPTFSGYINGRGYDILNIDVTQASNGYAGLFAQINDAEIFNLDLYGEVNVAAENAGLLAGKISNSTISESDVQVSLTNTAQYSHSGGLAGVIETSRIESLRLDALDVYPLEINGGALGGVAGSIEAGTTLDTIYVDHDLINSANSVQNHAGGIVGVVGSNSYLTDINFLGDVELFGSSIDALGGLAGLVISPYSQTRIEGCSIAATVQGNENAGGVVGIASGLQITGCLSSSTVSVKNGNAGGIAGVWYADGEVGKSTKIEKSTFIGTVTSIDQYTATSLGGAIGYANLGTARKVLIENFNSYAAIIGSSYMGGITGRVDAGVDLDVNYSYTALMCLGAEDSIQDKAHPVFGGGSISLEANQVFWDKDLCEIEVLNPIPGTQSLFTKNFLRPATFDKFDWDFENTWMFDEEFLLGYPLLRGVGGLPTYPFNPVANCVPKKLPAILFTTNSANLTASSKARLNVFATDLESSNCVKMTVVGYASKKEIKKGQKAAVWQKSLGQKRAQAIQNYLQTQFDIAKIEVTISTTSKGATKLAKKETSKSNIAKNRRALVSIS